MEVYPLVNIQKKLWKITIFHRQINYFYYFLLAIFNSYVKLPEGIMYHTMFNVEISNQLITGFEIVSMGRS